MRRAVLAPTLLAVLLLGGCVDQPDPKDSSSTLRAERSRIVGVLKDVAGDLSRDGGSASDGRGAYVSCGSAPTYAVEYRAGARLAGDGSPVAARLKAAVRALEGAGWKVTDATYTDDPYPNARLEKDGLKLALDPDARAGSDDLTFGLSGACVRTAKGQDSEFGGQEDLELG